MHRAAMLFLCLTAVAFPLSKSYDVVPYSNCIGTQTQGYVGVTQSYRNTLDDITRVSVWIGDTFTGGTYSVEVKDGNTVVARRLGVPTYKQWAWLDFDFDTNLVSPVRGKDYKVIVTRENGQPISFAYDTTDKYLYGCLSVGSIAHGRWDLAARTAI